MSTEKAVSSNETRKTLDARPSKMPVNYDDLIDLAIKRFPKVHEILSK